MLPCAAIGKRETYVWRKRRCHELIDGTNRATLAFGKLGDQAIRLLTLLLLATHAPLQAFAGRAHIGGIFLTVFPHRAGIVNAKCADLRFVFFLIAT